MFNLVYEVNINKSIMTIFFFFFSSILDKTGLSKERAGLFTII